jgi:hypothetical protein
VEIRRLLAVVGADFALLRCSIALVCCPVALVCCSVALVCCAVAYVGEPFALVGDLRASVRYPIAFVSFLVVVARGGAILGGSGTFPCGPRPLAGREIARLASIVALSSFD